MKSSLVACLWLAVLTCATACSPARFPVAFRNDLATSVVAHDCKACGNGRQVEPGATWHLKMEATERLRVTKPDGSDLGCAFMSSSSSTSQATEVTASSVGQLQCR